MKAYIKDSTKKVLQNKSRYISIIIIIALGVGFFTGMNSISLDMQKTAEKYLEESNVYDFQITYSLGILDKDIQDISKIEGVDKIETGYVYDALLETAEKKLVVRTNSITTQMNKNQIIEGRNVENNKECLIDQRLNSMYGYNIGDTINLKSGTDDDIDEIFDNSELKIVGIARNPVYISQYYGATKLENGDVSGLVMINPEVFKLEEHNVAYIKTNILNNAGIENKHQTSTKTFVNKDKEETNIGIFEDEYKEKINSIKEKIEKVAEVNAKDRYKEIYNEVNDKIQEAKTKVNDANSEIKDKQTDINDAKKVISSAYSTLGNSFVTNYGKLENIKIKAYQNLINKTRNTYIANYEKISDNNLEFLDAKDTFETAKKDANSDIDDANKDIEKATIELNSLEEKWTITGITDSDAFVSLKNDLSKMGIMGKAFPVIFFIVATLVTITTMTRTIEEDRSNIGTLKSLGYSQNIIKLRYISYAIITTLLGLIIGVYIGSYFITQILYAAYSSLYSLPSLITVLDWTYILISAIISVISIIVVVIIIASKEIKEKPAALLRPKAAKEGKQIFLEKWNWFWGRLGFLFKVSFRNIFRYKRRLFMTIIGIAGCTALIYTGIALKASIDSIGEKQFGEIRNYDIEVNLKNQETPSNLEELQQYITSQENIKSATPVRQKNLEIEKDGKNKKIMYTVIDSEDVKDYIKLQDMNSEEKLDLYENGVIITEKLAQTYNVKVGNYINVIEKSTGINEAVKITGITENYLYNFMYLTPLMYEKIYGTEVECNQFLVNTEELTKMQEDELIEILKQDNNVSSVTLQRLMDSEYQKSLKSLMSVVFMCIGCAIILAFVVLFNLNSINIEERKRELATMKVLGFYDNETSSYVFRENFILSILGVIVGLGFGMIMIEFIMQSAEVETILLSRKLSVGSFVLSALITIGCTLITNLFMNRSIKKIDMIDSLKSVE